MDKSTKKDCPCSESSKMDEMQKSISKIENGITEINTNLKWMTKQIEDICLKTQDDYKCGEDREKRLSILEKENLPERMNQQEGWQMKTLGALSIISIIVTVLIGVALKVIG